MSSQTSKTTVRSAVKAALGTSIAVPLLFAAVPAMAESDAVINLRNQINAMEARLDMMESQQDTDGNTIQLGDTSISMSGYIKLDAFYDMETQQGVSLLPSDVFNDPQFGGATGDEDAHLGWTAKQTRLRISTTTPTAVGDIGGYIEMDMYGEPTAVGESSGGGSPRLRQAYFTYGNWLFGRTWTTFANFYYGTSLNFAGPTGQVFARQEQIRYTMDLGNGSNFAIAIEDGSGRGNGDPELPDLTMRYQASMGDFGFQIAGLARQISADTTIGPLGNPIPIPGLVDNDDSVFGWGVNAGASLALATGTTLKLAAAYGEGVGSYIYAPNFGSVYVNADGELDTSETLGLIASVGQQFTDSLSGNLIYGYSNNSGDDTQDEFTGSSLIANLLYSPVDALVFGIEYTRVEGEVEYAAGGSDDGDANRVQFSTIYNF